MVGLILPVFCPALSGFQNKKDYVRGSVEIITLPISKTYRFGVFRCILFGSHIG